MLAIEIPTLVFSALSLIVLSCIGGGHVAIPNNNLQGSINTLSNQMPQILSRLSQIENMMLKTMSRDEKVTEMMKEQTAHLRYLAIS